MKRYVVPEDIKFTSVWASGMSFDNIDNCKKAIDFLLEIGCNFYYHDERIIQLNSNKARFDIANWRSNKEEDLLILSIFE